MKINEQIINVLAVKPFCKVMFNKAGILKQKIEKVYQGNFGKSDNRIKKSVETN